MQGEPRRGPGRIPMGPPVLTQQIMSILTRTVTEMSSSRNADTQTTMETLEAQRENLRELGGPTLYGLTMQASPSSLQERLLDMIRREEAHQQAVGKVSQ